MEIKKIVVKICGEQYTGERWTLAESHLERIAGHELRPIMTALQQLVVAYDNVPSNQQDAITVKEVVSNADKLVLLATYATRAKEKASAAHARYLRARATERPVTLSPALSEARRVPVAIEWSIHQMRMASASSRLQTTVNSSPSASRDPSPRPSPQPSPRTDALLNAPHWIQPAFMSVSPRSRSLPVTDEPAQSTSHSPSRHATSAPRGTRQTSPYSPSAYEEINNSHPSPVTRTFEPYKSPRSPSVPIERRPFWQI